SASQTRWIRPRWTNVQSIMARRPARAPSRQPPQHRAAQEQRAHGEPHRERDEPAVVLVVLHEPLLLERRALEPIDLRVDLAQARVIGGPEVLPAGPIGDLAQRRLVDRDLRLDEPRLAVAQIDADRRRAVRAGADRVDLDAGL